MRNHSPSVFTIASACTGYGGLDMAVELVLGSARHLWHAELNPNAARVLEIRYPGVPNLGDITRVAWRELAGDHRPDITTAGWPCQPFSAAGKRNGTADARHLWPYLEDYLYEIAPPIFIGENVPNLLTIEHGTAFGRILADLHRAGYTARWTLIGACAVGACHHRHRVVLVAARVPWTRPPRQGRRPVAPLAHLVMDAEWVRSDGRQVKWPQAGTMTGGKVWPEAADVCGAPRGSTLPTPRARDWKGGVDPAAYDAKVAAGTVHAGYDLPTAVRLLPTPIASLGRGAGLPSPALAQRRHDQGRRMLEDAIQLLPTPTVADSRNSRNSTANRSDGSSGSGGSTLSDIAHADRWGEYSPAIRRWESVLGRPAPEPIDPGPRGQRLNPRFAEWMMGIPEGWVTDLMSIDKRPRAGELSRTAALMAIGNGVNPVQVAEGLRRLGLPAAYATNVRPLALAAAS